MAKASRRPLEISNKFATVGSANIRARNPKIKTLGESFQIFLEPIIRIKRLTKPQPKCASSWESELVVP